jgi:membrane associated rhomboid family serine protease
VGADSVPGAVTDLPATNVRTCYRHPDRRAGVACQRCDRPICPQCMHQASVGFHCPECTKAGKQKVYTRANLQVLNRPLLTQVVIGINAAVFLAGVASESGDAFAGRGGFALDGGLFGPLVADGEWYRIITAGFLHAGLLHLGFNMFLLFQLGSMLEPALGRLRFGATYLVSLLTGSLGVLLLSPNSLTVGASGAVFGLMGLMFVAQRARGLDPWSSGIGSTIGINLLITFTIPGISIGGHVGGLVGGLACGWLLYEGSQTMGKQQALAAVVALGAAAAVGCILVA